MAGSATRNTQTRTRIKRAFTELLGEKGFDALTVSDLTRRAGINRGTFYLHFVDKYDLLDQLEGEVIEKLGEILLRPMPDRGGYDLGTIFPYERVREALSFVQGDVDFVSAVSGQGGDSRFSDKLKRLMGDLLDQGFRRAGARVRADGPYPAEYAREILLSHVMAIIGLWLRRRCAESPEEVARMICSSKDVAPSSLVGPDSRR